MSDKPLTKISFTRAKELTYFLPWGIKNTISGKYIGQGSPYNMVTFLPTSFGKIQIDDLNLVLVFASLMSFLSVFQKYKDSRLTLAIQINCARE